MSYASRKTQSRAETEANARILRALVKQPENKLCADCKRNDTRWASWNIGCFLCIRCSGFHRSMGTHISRVKSIDLDIWTPEQMESIQKWGNKRANAYWEAHLKPGHAPPDHKVESFIRSKYESRRWAMDAPVPTDPSVLDQGSGSAVVPTQTQAAPSVEASSSQPAVPKTRSNVLLDLLGEDDSGPKIAPTRAATLASSQTSTSTAAPASRTLSAATKGTTSGLFDLDWDGSASNSSTVPTLSISSMPSGMRAKNEILSLFSAPPPPKVNTTNDSLFTSLTSPQDGGLSSQLDTLSLGAPPAPSMTASRAPPAPPANDLFNTQDIWGSKEPAKKAPLPADDAFADIWGDFK
ncbi:ARF GAP with effector function(s) [Malassezia equina]|uniref:ARF GAP with effector function(S) n=1 Tax=Malassezia equina TaxID=1381935 RepID=A0AAF0EGV7_9BASI|nr:ARF GAP with effector function(s) [Malassezia equina]